MLPPGHRSCNSNSSYPITCACLRLLKCVLRDHNSNNCTHSDNVCCHTYMVNNDCDKFRSFCRLYMTLFWHRTCTYSHGRADRLLVLVSNGQVAALGVTGLIINRLCPDTYTYRQRYRHSTHTCTLAGTHNRTHTSACRHCYSTCSYKHMHAHTHTNTHAQTHPLTHTFVQTHKNQENLHNTQFTT